MPLVEQTPHYLRAEKQSLFLQLGERVRGEGGEGPTVWKSKEEIELKPSLQKKKDTGSTTVKKKSCLLVDPPLMEGKRLDVSWASEASPRKMTLVGDVPFGGFGDGKTRCVVGMKWRDEGEMKSCGAKETPQIKKTHEPSPNALGPKLGGKRLEGSAGAPFTSEQCRMTPC